MPLYEYITPEGRIELHRAVADRDKVPASYKRVTVPSRLSVDRKLMDPLGVDLAVPKALREEESRIGLDRLTRESGFTPKEMKRIFAKGFHALGCVLFLLVALSAQAGDITAGKTFQAGVTYYHYDFNTAFSSAQINSTFYTGKTVSTAPTNTALLLLYDVDNSQWLKTTMSSGLWNNSDLLYNRSENTNVSTNDLFLTYSASGSALFKTTFWSLLKSGFTNFTATTNAPGTNAFMLTWNGQDIALQAVKGLTNNPVVFSQFSTNLPAANLLTTNTRVWVQNGDTNYNLPAGVFFTNWFTNSLVWFESTNNSMSVTSSVAHNLGGYPHLLTLRAICVTADNGYRVGDELDPALFMRSSGDTSVAVGTAADATNVHFVVTSGAIVSMPRNGSAPATITASSWRLNVRAARFR